MTSKDGSSDTTATRLVDEIRTMIANGELAPGVALAEQDLAVRLGVSRTPLREALAYLHGTGIVVDRPKRSSVVLLPSADDLNDIYELRITLEAMAMRQAIDRLQTEDVAAARGLHVEMLDARDTREWARLNHAFHMTTYRYSSARLRQLIDNLRTQSDPFVTRLLGPSLSVAEAEHAAILDAIEARDAGRADSLIREHLAGTLEAVLRVVGRAPTDSAAAAMPQQLSDGAPAEALGEAVATD